MTSSDISRRTLFTAAGLGATAAALSACSTAPSTKTSGSGSGAPVTLEIWMYNEPSRTAIQNAQIAAYKIAHPEVTLNVTRTDFTTYYSKLATAIASQRLPDVFMMSGAYFYSAANQGALLDLTQHVSKAGLKIENYFGTPTGEDISFDGKMYGIPGEIDSVALAYNINMFNEAKIPLPEAGWTWDQLLEAAKALTRKGSDGKQRYGFYSRNSSQEAWGSFVRQNGGNFLDKTYTKGALDSAEALEAIQFSVDLIHKYKVSPSPLGVSSLPGYIESTGNPFLTGLLGMKFQGNYEMALLSQIKDFDWNVCRMPKKVVPGGIGWYQSWVIGSTTKAPDAAWALLNFLVTDGQKVLAETPGRGLTPSLKSAASSAAFQGNGKPDMKAWTDGWQEHFDFAFHPAWLEYQGIYSKALDDSFNSNAPIEPAIKTATDQVNATLGRYPWFDSSKLKPVAWQ